MVGKVIERHVLNYRELRSFPGTLSEMSPNALRCKQRMDYMPKSNRGLTLILTSPTLVRRALMMDLPKFLEVRVSQA